MLFSELIHHGTPALRGASKARLPAGGAASAGEVEVKPPGFNALSAPGSVK